MFVGFRISAGSNFVPVLLLRLTPLSALADDQIGSGRAESVVEFNVVVMTRHCVLSPKLFKRHMGQLKRCIYAFSLEQGFNCSKEDIKEHSFLCFCSEQVWFSFSVEGLL